MRGLIYSELCVTDSKLTDSKLTDQDINKGKLCLLPVEPWKPRDDLSVPRDSSAAKVGSFWPRSSTAPGAVQALLREGAVGSRKGGWNHPGITQVCLGLGSREHQVPHRAQLNTAQQHLGHLRSRNM